MKRQTILTAVLAFLLAVGGFTLGVSTTDDGHGNSQHSLSFHFDRSGAPGVQTGTQTVPAPAVAATQGGLETHMRSETPPGTPPDQLQAAQHAAARIAEQLPPLPTAGATAEVPGCVTHFIGSYSTRHGVRPVQFYLHYTVSHNVPGWSDVWAVVDRFANANNGASSNFVIDAEGHCAYIVPIEYKAWTQAAANPFAISFEVIDYGNESAYMQPPGYAKLRSVLRILSKRTGIPLRRGAVKDCAPAGGTAGWGIVQHHDAGICGGGHVDIDAGFPMAPVVKILTQSQPVPKAVKWARHRLALHVAYQQKCRHAYQRKVRPVTCAKLRSDARKLDRLLKRKT